MRSFRRGSISAFLTALLLAAGWSETLRAEDMPRMPTPDADAARLVETVLRQAEADDWERLGAWTRSVTERVLDRAGESARQSLPGRAGEAAPLPAERHAGEFGGPRSGMAEILIFTSLSVPAASWRQWARDAARSGAPLVLRGVGEGGLPETAKRIGRRLGGAEAGSLPSRLGGRDRLPRSGVAIDPRLFRLFGVMRVPAVVVVPGGVPPCRSRGCAGDPAPPHDLVSGNIGLIAALEAIAEEGAAGRGMARRHLERLRGEERP
ncbi:MAG: type-F conjugative transfer system pilin assembly protein TrbC [Alphaproteobacteria bacterium]|nr:type-F conjugative transfer system pilin assembly protein TrbC [Alphaproteobacteria bacterium]